jgi:hypothetical protein
MEPRPLGRPIPIPTDLLLHDTIMHALLDGGREPYNKVGLTSNSMTFMPNWLQWFKITAV